MDFPEIPGYKIKSRLGKGGMAIIYLAEQLNFGREVALKVMSPHLVSDPSFGERFMREARIVAQMSHPNFVPVYDVGRHEDYTYMSMEYLPAGDLKGLMRSGLALADGVRIVKEIASALNYAARKHFIHRDIKPENVLLREDLTAVVCDFGIAKQTNASTQMTMVGTVIGTPHYMSPEQAQAAVLDERSDLYSLGVIFFEMLTGHVPYSGHSAVTTGIMHVTEPIPELPPDLAVFQDFVDITLAKLPEDRYQTGLELADALEELEEQNYDQIHAASATVMLSESEMLSSQRRSTSGSQRRSTTSGQRRGGTGSRSGRAVTGTRTGASGVRKRKVGPARSGTSAAVPRRGMASTRNKVMAISVAATLGVGATGWWYSSSQRGTTSYDPATISVTSGNFAAKAEDLREKAEDALDDGRLYGPGDDNAQSYLTTLLVLVPDDSAGKASITRLFGIYLEQASEAVDEGNFPVATATLNQASQISFYIEETALVEQQSDLRRMLIGAQQQAIIASQRQEQINILLADAEVLLADGKLTTPADGNAYDKFQEVLSLAPSNDVASEGIKNIAGSFLSQAREQISQGQIGRARSYVAAAVQIYPQHSDMAGVRTEIMNEEERLQDEVSQQQQQLTAAQEGERAKQQQARKDRAQNVESLLAAAVIDIKADRLSSPEGNNAIDKYNQVLDLDPANVDALNGLEDVAKRYIEVALDLIRAGKLDQAERNLVRAKILSPSSPEYTAAQMELIGVRDLAQQQAAAEAAKNERITALLKGAELAVKKGNIYLPRGNNALENLRQVLELDSKNPSALKLRVSLNDKLQKEAIADIKGRRLDDAKLAIDALVSNNASDGKVDALRKQLSNEQVAIDREIAEASKRKNKAREKAEREQLAREKAATDKANRAKTEQQRLAEQQQQQAVDAQQVMAEASEAEKLLAQASAMGGPGRVTSVNYRKLAELYGKVLALEPQNSAASRGLSEVSSYTARQAGFAITGRDFRAATMYIDYLEKVAPRSSALSKLREDLAYSQRQQEQAIEILAAADALIASPYKKPGMFGNNNKPRQTLLAAFGKIESARQVDATSPMLARSEQKLVKKYTDIINMHLKDEDIDEAKEFLEDLISTKLAQPQVAILQQQIEAMASDSEESGQVSVSSF